MPESQNTPLEENIQSTSHNALLPMGYFVQEVMLGDSDETHLKAILRDLLRRTPSIYILLNKISIVT